QPHTSPLNTRMPLPDPLPNSTPPPTISPGTGGRPRTRPPRPASGQTRAPWRWATWTTRAVPRCWLRPPAAGSDTGWTRPPGPTYDREGERLTSSHLPTSHDAL